MLPEPVFEGFDNDIKSSLHKYGFVCRNEKSDQYFCFYQTDKLKYDYGFIHESDISDLLNLTSWLEEKKRNEFLKYCGQDLKTFNKLPFIHKAYSLIQFFGHEDIMGKSINPLTFMEVVDMIENE